ncbi:MAG: hypothetical protein COY47_04520, partial [Chloroflexi bacterium CG_4_10_14_0_8_um_filter_57_5]
MKISKVSIQRISTVNSAEHRITILIIVTSIIAIALSSSRCPSSSSVEFPGTLHTSNDQQNKHGDEEQTHSDNDDKISENFTVVDDERATTSATVVRGSS